MTNAPKWQAFEKLVAAIHVALNGSEFDVRTDETLVEPEGATHQIDVILRPKSPFMGPTLISCKAWSAPVGVSHIREWADIVQQTGAAAGVVVAQSGFTADALNCARNPVRRISLWVPRPLTEADFAPDEESPDGYIAAVTFDGTIIEPELVPGTFKLDVERPDGTRGTDRVEFNFSAVTRNQWHLRDETDSIVGNLWDQFVSGVAEMKATSSFEIVPSTPTFLALGGIKVRLNQLTCMIDVHVYETTTTVDVRDHALAYENALTKQILIVPLPFLRQADRPE
jgi:hypothetical protein